MGKTYETISPGLARWIEAQHMFFVASAPGGDDGHVNCSPRGMDCFRITGPREVAWLDLTGSGAETMAHLKENGRLCIMFCAFEGAANIVRLQGRGEVLALGTPAYELLAPLFPELPGARAVIRLAVDRIADSCGYSVPLMRYEGERDTLVQWAERKGPEGLETYRRTHNARSLDDLPAWEP